VLALGAKEALVTPKPTAILSEPQVNLFAMVPAIFASGWACDRPSVRRVWMALVAYALIAALSVPMFIWFKRGWATCWGLQLVFMLLLSVVLGEGGGSLLPVQVLRLQAAKGTLAPGS
jgi:hypothetical protein